MQQIGPSVARKLLLQGSERDTYCIQTKKNNPGTGPQTGEIGPIGPQKANRGWPVALPKIPENWKIAQKLGFGGVWGETGTSKHLLGTIQSIWVTGFPRISILEPVLKQNCVFRTTGCGLLDPDGGGGPAGPPPPVGSVGQVSEIQGTL